MFKNGTSIPSRVPITETDITTIINKAHNIPTSRPRVLTQEEMRMARHSDMYMSWNIISSFIGKK